MRETGLAIAVVTIWTIAAGILYLGGLLTWRSTAQVPSATPGAAAISVGPPTGCAGALTTVSGQGWGPGEVVFNWLRRQARCKIAFPMPERWPIKAGAF